MTNDNTLYFTKKDQNYYILSLKWTNAKKNRDTLTCVWWASDNNGYVTDLSKAGIYSYKEVISNQSYYNDKVDTLAVRCEEAKLRSKQIVSMEHINQFKKYEIPKTSKMKKMMEYIELARAGEISWFEVEERLQKLLEA